MKLLTGSALALTISLGAMSPAFAGMVPSGEINGEVQSIDGSSIVVRAEDGSNQEFSIDPALISSYGLQQGSSVRIDGSGLRRGVITGVDDNTIKVRHDNGDTETYVFFREGRRFLSYGDRVIVNSQGKIESESSYRLTATEITPAYDFLVASSSSQQIASVPVEQTITPVVPAVPQPVQGLW